VHRLAAAAICTSVAFGDVSKRISRRCGGDWSSIVVGVNGEPAIASARAPRLRRSPTEATSVDDACGSGASLNVALVITARLPSDPHSSFDRS
jgi:hypothetical protein